MSRPDTPSTDSTPPFCADGADVIIRVEGEDDYGVHKSLLSFVSPFFKDMFAVPQPATDNPDVLPHLEVQDPPEAWENILRTIYPVPNPTIDNLDDLESLLLTAKKYDMQFVLDSHIQPFENQAFIREDPLRLYVIACAAGLEEQAKYVASHAELSTIAERPDVGDLKYLTLRSYHQLVSFLIKRDKGWDQILAKAPIPRGSRCTCTSSSKGNVYGTIKKDLGRPHLSTDEIYLKSLERSSTDCCGSEEEVCALVAAEVRGFIDSMAKRKDGLCSELMWS